MISNSDLTVFHKIFDNDLKKELWEKHTYNNIWWFESRGANTEKGYNETNTVQIRISYELNPDIKDFGVGDILIKGIVDYDIDRQQDLENEKIFNITNINDNRFGRRPHIHISGE